MYHFLFSFPRARAVPRQVSECGTVMVPWHCEKPPALASGPVPCTSFFIHYYPVTLAVSTPFKCNQPIGDGV